VIAIHLFELYLDLSDSFKYILLVAVFLVLIMYSYITTAY
jgi:hypothetical protein